MKLNTLLAIAAVAIFTGCRPANSPVTYAINQANANSPEFVADTPMGKLYRINIDRGSEVRQDRIYFFDKNTNIVNINSTIQSGKFSHVQSVVIIDGVEYIRK